MTLHELEPGTEVILESARLFEQPLRLQQMDGRLFVVKESHLIGGIRVYTLDHCDRSWVFLIPSWAPGSLRRNHLDADHRDGQDLYNYSFKPQNYERRNHSSLFFASVFCCCLSVPDQIERSNDE